MNYRLYLLDSAPSIRAAESYVAANDAEAAEIAAAICNAAGDVFQKCELWRGAEQLATLWPDGRNAIDQRRRSLDISLAARQERILEVEDRLQRSFACVRSSRQLLQTYARLVDLR